MASLRLKLASVGGAGALLASLFLANPAVSLAADGGHSFTCHGGSIPAGTYSSLVVAGPCTLDAGSVTVRHDLDVSRGGELIAAFGGSDLTVRGDLEVGRNAILVLGCEPNTGVTCFNDPSLTSNDHISGDLTSLNALAVLVHHVTVGDNVTQNGGGGGVNCTPVAALQGSPAFATYEDVTIGGSARIAGFRSCWLGFFRNSVHGSVTFVNNVVADPDGNEVATNTIGHDLRCSGNSPAAQIGDSGGALNTVGGRATGQCKSLKV